MNARGYPCAKGYNSSASQWLSGEQVRLCPGHPKVHFGTIAEGSLGRGGGGGGRCMVGPPGSLIITPSPEARRYVGDIGRRDDYRLIWVDQTKANKALDVSDSD